MKKKKFIQSNTKLNTTIYFSYNIIKKKKQQTFHPKNFLWYKKIDIIEKLLK